MTGDWKAHQRRRASPGLCPPGAGRSRTAMPFQTNESPSVTTTDEMRRILDQRANKRIDQDTSGERQRSRATANFATTSHRCTRRG